MKNPILLLLSGLFLSSINLSAEVLRKDTLLANFEDQSTFFSSIPNNHTRSVVPNPNPSGQNISNYVLKIEATSATGYDAFYTPSNTTTLSLNIDAAGGYRYLHFKVYKDFISSMLWGFHPLTAEGTVGGTKYPQQKSNTLTGEWEYLVVDLLGLTGDWNILPGTYCRINFNMTKQANSHGAFVGYLDDIYLSDKSTPIPIYTVSAGGTNTASAYQGGDVVFYSNDTQPAGQLTEIEENGLQVTDGVVKLVKTFTEEQWYPIGFPFEIASVVDQADGTVLQAYNGDADQTAYTDNGTGDYWLKYYDGVNNEFRYPGSGATIAAHTGYIIQFPDYYEDKPITVVFSSTSNPVLKNTSTLSQTTLAAQEDNHGYYLVANPSVAKVASLNDVDRYYKYDNNNHFGLLSGEVTDIDLNPFEAIVAVKKKDDTTPLRASLWTEDDNSLTGLRKPDAIRADDAVIETKYYNLQGVEIRQPAAAEIHIVKKIHASGKIEATKSFYKINHQ